ncbi:uncharacterized protein LOC103524116 [Trichonephila clavipes]|nr:uncharacterized protein LOC103524116 [Trichonephila clavipes]
MSDAVPLGKTKYAWGSDSADSFIQCRPKCKCCGTRSSADTLMIRTAQQTYHSFDYVDQTSLLTTITVGPGTSRLDVRKSSNAHKGGVPRSLRNAALLYADDLVLWSTGSYIPKLESTLNSALVTLSNWSLENEERDLRWGSSQSDLISTFTSYIRPVIDYGSELLVTASDGALSKFNIVQNKCLRFITGTATSTPISSIQMQIEISSSSEIRQYSALSLGERLMSIRSISGLNSYLPKQDLKLNILNCLSSRRVELFLVFPIIDFPSLDLPRVIYASANLHLFISIILSWLSLRLWQRFMKDIQIKIGYTDLLMALPQLPLEGLVLYPTLLILKT